LLSPLLFRFHARLAVVNLFACPHSPVAGIALAHYDRDMNFGFSGEMIFIFFLALILFGPKKMPEIGRQVARFLNEFRRASNEFRSQIESEINNLDSSNPKQQILPPLQAPLGSLANRIFNPPSPEKLEAAEAEDEAAEQAAVRASAAESVASDESTHVPKAAPDA
jgi:Sec-independent protein translocase protein TatA